MRWGFQPPGEGPILVVLMIIAGEAVGKKNLPSLNRSLPFVNPIYWLRLQAILEGSKWGGKSEAAYSFKRDQRRYRREILGIGDGVTRRSSGILGNRTRRHLGQPAT